jgi:hypothetical protein
MAEAAAADSKPGASVAARRAKAALPAASLPQKGLMSMGPAAAAELKQELFLLVQRIRTSAASKYTVSGSYHV